METKTLHKIPYGVYIISSKNHDKNNGQIANAIFQVTSTPPTVAISINKENLTHDYIAQSKVFSISILCKNTPMPFIGTFGFKSGRTTDKFKDTTSKTGITGAPIVLDHTLGYIEATTLNHIDIGTHTIFIGKIEDAQILTDDEPMTYEYYHKVKGGISPKSAPTYDATVDKIKRKEDKKMDKYVCTVCGYVYDPAKGDPDSGIAAGTPFEDIPDDWVCPVCGAAKEAFEKQ